MFKASNKYHLFFILLLLISSLFFVTSATQATPGAQPEQSTSLIEDCLQAHFHYGALRWDEALPLLESIFEQHTHITQSPSSTNEDKNWIGQCIMILGAIHHQTMDWQRAMELYQVGIDIFRRTDHAAMHAVALNNIALIHARSGHYGQAIEESHRLLTVIKYARDRGLPQPFNETFLYEISAYNNLGLLYAQQGRFELAQEQFQDALETAQLAEAYTEETVIQENLQEDLPPGFDELERFEEAGDPRATEILQLVNQGINELGKIPGQAIGFTKVSTLNHIGMLAASQGDYDQAVIALQDSLDIGRELQRELEQSLRELPTSDTDGQDRQILERQFIDHEILIINNLAAVYNLQQKHEQALDTLEQAYQMSQTGNIGDPFTSALITYNSGLSIMPNNQMRAFAFFEDALEILSQTHAPGLESDIMASIGSFYAEQNQFDRALEYFETSLALRERIRAVAGSEQGRMHYFSLQTGLYEQTIDLYYQQGQDEHLKNAFLLSERGRARAFLDSLATGTVQLQDNPHAELFNREHELYATLQDINASLISARNSATESNETLIRLLEKRQTTVEEEYQEVLRRIDQRDDQLRDLIPGRSRVLTVTGVQEYIQPHTTLVSFFVLADKTLAFLIGSNTFDVLELPVTRKDLVQQVEAFQLFPEIKSSLSHPEEAKTLHRTLIEPLEQHIPSETVHLMIVPHGILHYLPFAALTDGRSYLLDDYTITTLPSASILPYVQKRDTQPVDQKVLVLGDPDISAEISQQTGLRPLLYAEGEAEFVASLYNQEALTGVSATEAVLRTQVAQAHILHIAAHAQYDWAAPMNSAVYLAPEQAATIQEGNDGVLHVYELYDLPLQQTELVVLSACETQLGTLGLGSNQSNVLAGDEIVSLTRAFLFAGASTVVSTLWNVDDKATQFLMEYFHKNLDSGLGPTESLQQAQIELREQYPDPYYWAAFVVSGASGEIILEQMATNLKEQHEDDVQNSRSSIIPRQWLQVSNYLPWLLVIFISILIFILFLRITRVPPNTANESSNRQPHRSSSQRKRMNDTSDIDSGNKRRPRRRRRSIHNDDSTHREHFNHSRNRSSNTDNTAATETIRTRRRAKTKTNSSGGYGATGEFGGFLVLFSKLITRISMGTTTPTNDSTMESGRTRKRRRRRS